jgi:hypothetical protein
MAAIRKTEKALSLRTLEAHEQNDAGPDAQRGLAVHDRSHDTEKAAKLQDPNSEDCE